MNLRVLLGIVVFAAMAVLVWVARAEGWLTLENVAAQREAFDALLTTRPLLVAGGYFAIYVGVAALSLPGAAALTVTAGFLFGTLFGTVLVSFASTLGATLAMLLVRLFFRDAMTRRFADTFAVIDRGIEREGWMYLLTLRLVPAFPFFVVNILMGLTRIGVLTFFLVSQLGMLPATVVYVYAGEQLGQVDALGDILSPGMILALTALAALPWIARFVASQLSLRRRLGGHRRPRGYDYNLVVIGAGSAGLISALVAATVKAKVALIERDRMGGDCLNTGCVPSKTLLHSAAVAQTFREASRHGVLSTVPSVDFSAVMDRVREVIARIEPNDSVERYHGLGVECIRGEARLVDPWTVEVGERRLTARRIVLATGASPLVPPIPGLDQVDPLTSETLWDLEALPARLLVLGGGPIGCELAQAFRRLGAQVTLVDMAPRILPREDADAAGVIEAKLRSEGVELRTGHRAIGFEREGSGGALRAEGPGGEVRISFDRVLVAVGRRANVDGLGLEALGIELRRDGTIEVDEYLRTRVPTIYAAGDVTGPYQFTHMASHQAWYTGVNGVFGMFRKYRANYSIVPWVTYTDPEVARVGLSEAEARERGIEVQVSRHPFSHVDRALAEGAENGFIKVLTPPGRDRILGVTIVGARAGELLAEYVLAMTHGLGLSKIMGTIHVYPTFSEANKFAASAWRRANAPTAVFPWLERLHGWMRGDGFRRAGPVAPPTDARAAARGAPEPDGVVG